MLIAGAAGGGLFLIILIVCIICCVKRKQKKRKDASKISVNKVVPTDMTDFDQMQSVPDYDPKGSKSKCFIDCRNSALQEYIKYSATYGGG